MLLNYNINLHFRPTQSVPRWPAIDLAVALITFPILVVLTLLLDFNLTTDWQQSSDSAIVVLVLIGAFAAVCLFTIGYVFYRLGVRLWAGPLEAGDFEAAAGAIGASNASGLNPSGGQLFVLDVAPPSYDWLMSVDEEALPKYDDSVKVTTVATALPTYESVGVYNEHVKCSGLVLHV